MPKGVYERTDWHKSRISNLFQKGHKVPEEWKKSYSEKNKLYKHTEEARKKISEANLKRVYTKRKVEIVKEKKPKYTFPKGIIPWNKGKYKENYIESEYRQLNKKLRRTKQWTHWRTQVFQRDGYMCQECGKKNTYLHPHHIVSVKQCVEIKNIPLVYDVNNGLTLCVPCHKLKHKKITERND